LKVVQLAREPIERQTARYDPSQASEAASGLPAEPENGADRLILLLQHLSPGRAITG
jgi:hypothetical protein